MFAGLPVLNKFHVQMVDQLKDLTAHHQKIGELQSLDSGKKDKSSQGYSFLARDAGSTGPVNDPGPVLSQLSPEGTPEVQVDRLARKKKGHPEDVDSGAEVVHQALILDKVPGTSNAPLPPPPSNLKDWISTIPPPMRRRELFYNYASIQEKRIFRREIFN